MNKKPTKVILYQKIPGRLAIEEQLMLDQANLFGIPVVMASEKMMERGRVDVDESCLVSGSTPFVHHALRHLNASLPEHTPYPDVLAPWLHRRVWKESQLRNVLDRLNSGAAPVFVKPAKGWKRFTGFVAQFKDDYRFNGASKYDPVWVSEPISFVSEWRAYVANGEILEIKLADYGGKRNVEPDRLAIESAVEALKKADLAPAGFVIDFGVTPDGATALIEMNDGFSFGAYDGLRAETYWSVISSRWFELLGQREAAL